MNQNESSTVPNKVDRGTGYWIRRGAAIVMVAVIACIAVVLDRQLIASPDGGYVADSATWQLQAADLPAFLRHWNDLNTSAAMRRASPALHQAVPLAICRMTGVRPTPGRTRLWLGQSFLIAGDHEGWCLSLRPGIALRTASWLGSPLRQAEDDDFWRDYATAWKDGFLLVASSQGYLDKVKAGGKAVPRTDAQDDAIRLSWKGTYSGVLEIAAAEQIPLLFRIEAPADPEAKLHYAAGWPDALLTINTHRGAPVVQAALEGIGWAEARVNPQLSLTFRHILAVWWPVYCPVPLDQAPVGEWAAGIANIDVQEDVPVVESVWAGWAAEPAALAALAPASRQEHRWDEVSGWLYPIAGDARAWAQADREGAAFLSSHEHRMPALLATARREPEAGVAAFNLRWNPFTALLRDALIRAAADGLLPGYNENDVKADLVPIVDAFADWGTLQLHAGGEGGVIAGDGWVALGAELVP